MYLGHDSFNGLKLRMFISWYSVTKLLNRKNSLRLNKIIIWEYNNSVDSRHYHQKYFGKLIALSVRNLFGTVISDRLRKFHCNDWSDIFHDCLYLNKQSIS
jgi:hypothetical protein